jgi:hypothetical protein
MTWPDLKQDVEHWLFMFHLSSMSNDKDRVERTHKKYGLHNVHNFNNFNLA